MGPDSDLQATGSFVRAQVVKLLFLNCLLKAGGLISVLPTTGVDLDNLYPPSKGTNVLINTCNPFPTYSV